MTDWLKKTMTVYDRNFGSVAGRRWLSYNTNDMMKYFIPQLEENPVFARASRVLGPIQ